LTIIRSRGITGNGRVAGAHRTPRALNNVQDMIFVVASTGLANVVLYLFLAIAARALVPAEFGLFSSLFGFVVFFGIVATALQTSVAGRVATMEPGQRAACLSEIASATARLTAYAALALGAASPVIARLVHDSSYGAVLAAGAVATTLIPWSVLLGAFQGMQRFKVLGSLTFLQAVARLATALVFLWTRDLTVLLCAVAVSVVLPLAIGWALIGDGRPRLRSSGDSVRAESPGRKRWPTGAGPDHALTARRSVFGWTLVTVIATAFPTVGDVIVVRHVYSAHQAGLYAGVALVGRCVLFLPVGVNAVLYPRYMAMQSGQAQVRLRNQGLMITSLLCILAAGVLAADPGLTMTTIVGHGYTPAAGILRIYLFSSLGFALASNFAYYQLARANSRYALGVLVPCLLLICALPMIFSASLYTLVLGMSVLAVSLLVVSAIVSKVVDPA
jgi:O-antigen/teichoic acid export membrane protein